MNDRAGINYGRFMERAMRTVMAEVLGQVAEDGLPGDHHFYITFDTSHAGVDMPAHLKAAHPGDMMIVMKHWFDDLAVMGDRFQVTLNFSNVPETLVIPFDAVRTFIDPSVKFGLKFDDNDPEEVTGPTPVPDPEPLSDEEDRVAPLSDIAPEDADEPAAGAEVVSLDTFRKS